jgi:hypothetical protein
MIDIDPAEASRYIFLSYVEEDTAFAQRIAADLQRAGITVWMARERIAPGKHWKLAIRRAIREGAFFVACFSQAYHQRQKTYMNEELTLAIEELRQMPTHRSWFIPVLLSECQVPERDIGAGQTLHDIQFIKLYEDWSSGMRLLLSTILSDEQRKLMKELQKFARSIHQLEGLIYHTEDYSPDDDPDDDERGELAEIRQLYETKMKEFHALFGWSYDPYNLL